MEGAVQELLFSSRVDLLMECRSISKPEIKLSVLTVAHQCTEDRNPAASSCHSYAIRDTPYPNAHVQGGASATSGWPAPCTPLAPAHPQRALVRDPVFPWVHMELSPELHLVAAGALFYNALPRPLAAFYSRYQCLFT